MSMTVNKIHRKIHRQLRRSAFNVCPPSCVGNSESVVLGQPDYAISHHHPKRDCTRAVYRAPDQHINVESGRRGKWSTTLMIRRILSSSKLFLHSLPQRKESRARKNSRETAQSAATIGREQDGDAFRGNGAGKLRINGVTMCYRTSCS